MNKFALAAVAASLIASPAFAAAPQNHGNGNGYGHGRPQVQKVVRQQAHRPAPVQYRNNWQRGQRFESRYARNYRQVDYRQYRHLKAPPRGYHYVQSGNDAVLVGITSGIIAAVFANMIR